MMCVLVGPLEYGVELVSGYIRHEEEDCLGLCDNEQQQLYISDCTTPDQRVAVFCHEYMEAWLYHFGGEDKSKEGYCDLFGLAMAQFIQQFAAGFTIESSVGVSLPKVVAKIEGPKIKVTQRIVPGEPGSGERPWRVQTIEPLE